MGAIGCSLCRENGNVAVARSGKSQGYKFVWGTHAGAAGGPALVSCTRKQGVRGCKGPLGSSKSTDRMLAPHQAKDLNPFNVSCEVPPTRSSNNARAISHHGRLQSAATLSRIYAQPRPSDTRFSIESNSRLRLPLYLSTKSVTVNRAVKMVSRIIFWAGFGTYLRDQLQGQGGRVEC